MNKRPILECYNINKSFPEGIQTIQVLHNINFHVSEGECIAIIGASGSGKSTLLHILGGLERADSGDVHILGRRFADLTELQRNQTRNRNIGFVYQFHHLLPEFSVLENICMPLFIRGIHQKKAFQQALPLVHQLDLFDKRHKKPSEISGGEKQRTAIARALLPNPACILADEPTGNLDAQTAMQVFNTLKASKQMSLVLVTHDYSLANKMDKIFELKNGILSPLSDKK